MSTFVLPVYYERDPLDRTRFVVEPKKFNALGAIRENIYTDTLFVGEIEHRLAKDLQTYPGNVVQTLAVVEVRTARVYVRLTATAGNFIITAVEASGIAASAPTPGGPGPETPEDTSTGTVDPPAGDNPLFVSGYSTAHAWVGQQVEFAAQSSYDPTLLTNDATFLPL